MSDGQLMMMMMMVVVAVTLAVTVIVMNITFLIFTTVFLHLQGYLEGMTKSKMTEYIVKNHGKIANNIRQTKIQIRFEIRTRYFCIPGVMIPSRAQFH